MNEVRNGLAENASATVGSQLRAARESQSLTLGEIAERTRIPTRHLNAIESDDHSGLPAATYSSGFVKTYARLLGLDGQAMSQQFRAELSEHTPRTAYQEVYEAADPARTPTRGIAWASLLVAAVLILGFLYWRGMRTENPVAVAASATDTAPAPVAPRPAPTAPAPVAATDGATVLTAESGVWLRVSEPDGRKLFEGLLDTGKSYTVPAEAVDPRLLTGRPNALKVTVGSTVIPPLGPPEQRIRDVSLKPAALLGRAAAAPGGDVAIPTPVPASGNAAPVPAGAPTPVTTQAGPN
ncbi:DUF4115 domain-containing protein [Sphingomonas sp. BIUV-7]|uniref:DUF4115 domain-containing protein n=1 Tax=Sphingomonas natans TaxID=3063330 RepID=A0ABT8Y4H6_9SPHN|nr:helix-turn-helix domain-containing protein [Sphingomonas sp. BIUV-7]MDO6413209.1 DUF4115 domain-containing protein [Sphingomonas sp. BIUV-7]